MITNISNEKSHEELIIEKGVLCAQIEAGNPFLGNQEFEVSTYEDELEKTGTSCSFSVTPISKEDIKFYREKALQRSLDRKHRIPNNLAINHSVALNYLRLGEFDKAIDSFKKILSVNSGYFPAIAKLAECFLIKGEAEKAIDVYMRNLEVGKGKLNFLTNLAILFLKNGENDNALEYFNKAIKIAPNNPYVLNNIGLVCLAQRNPSQGIHYIKKAIKINNAEYNFYNNLGVCFIAIKNNKKALYYFKIAHSLNKSAINVIHNLSNSLVDSGEYESCINLLGEYLINHPEDVEKINILARCYFELKLYKKCLQELKRAIQYADENDNKTIASIYNNIALIYDRIGEPLRAKEYFQKCLIADEEPEEDITYNLLDFFFKYKEIEKAKLILDVALSKDPNNALLLSYLGHYYRSIGKYSDSIKIFQQSLSIDETLVDPYLGLSTIALDVDNNFDEAIEILDRGFKHHAHNIAMVNNYAYSLILSNNLKAAREILDTVDSGNSVHIIATEGLLYLREDNLEKGRKLYNKAARLAGQNYNLRSLVLQKKELELSNYFIMKGNKKEALRRIKKGLQYKTIEQYYNEKLKEMHKMLL